MKPTAYPGGYFNVTPVLYSRWGKISWVPIWLILAITFLPCPQVSAQAAKVELSGRVLSISGATIPNAHVTVKNGASGEAKFVVSNADGSYKVAGLLPGTYEVSAVAPGFNESRTTVIITGGANQLADLILKASASAPNGTPSKANQTSAATAPSGEGMSAKEISQLPLQGRSATNAAALEPGVLRTRSSARAGPNGYGKQLAIFGGRPRQNSSRLDGISVSDYANGPMGNALGTTLGVDALDRLSVLTRNDAAEYGRSSGGYISASTRAGTNNFHGNAFEYFRDSSLDARDYFDLGKPPLRLNQFGVSAGGPIFHDRVFFFDAYEGIRQSQGTAGVAVTPSLAARSGLLSTGTVTVDPQITRYLDAFYPLPNAGLLGAGDLGVHVGTGQRVRPGNHNTIRIDYKPSSRDSLYGVDTIESGSNIGPDRFIEKLYEQNSRDQFFTVGETHNFSSRTLNSFRFGIYRMVADIGNTAPASNPLSGDLSYGFLPGQPHGMIRVPGLSNMGNGVGGPDHLIFHWTSFQAYNDVSMVRGKHTLKFGVAIERMRDNIAANQTPSGEFIFNSLSDFLTNQPASFTAGFPNSQIGRSFRQTLFGAYVQDDWRTFSNLTLSMGLRYETVTVPSEVNGRLTSLRNLTDSQPWCQTYAPGCNPQNTGGTLFSNPTRRNFEPRVGFAWDPFHKGSPVISSGFGIFDVQPLLYEIQYSELFSAPFYLSGSATNLPAGSFPTGGYTIAAASPTGLSQAYFEPHPKRNYVMQWNFTTQWRLPKNVSMKLGYVGSHGVHHIFRVRDANMVLPTLTSAGYLWPKDPGTRLNPSVGSINAAFWEGDSSYNALVAQVQARFGRTGQIIGSYTWGKSIDTSSGSIAGDEYSNAISSPLWFDTQLNRGQSDYDITHSLKIIYSWQIPSPKTLTGAEAWPLSGWQIGGVFEASTGVPFTAGFGGDSLGVSSTDTNLNVPNVTAGCSLVNRGNFANYINTNCFELPPPTPAIQANCDIVSTSTIDPVTNQPEMWCRNLRGNLGRNLLIGPGRLDMNFTVFKNNFIPSVSSAFNVQFRAEFFNIFNHPNINAPLNNRNVFDSKGNVIGSAGLTDSTQTSPRNVQFAIKVIW